MIYHEINETKYEVLHYLTINSNISPTWEKSKLYLETETL